MHFIQSYPRIKNYQLRKFVFSLDIEASPKVLQFEELILQISCWVEHATLAQHLKSAVSLKRTKAGLEQRRYKFPFRFIDAVVSQAKENASREGVVFVSGVYLTSNRNHVWLVESLFAKVIILSFSYSCS